MSRENVYNPILRILQKQRLASFGKTNPKLFSPASSKEEFFTLKRNQPKKSMQSLQHDQAKQNRSHDRTISLDFAKQDWQSHNISQQIFATTSTDDDLRTTSTMSYETHEENQTSQNNYKKKKLNTQCTDCIEIINKEKNVAYNNNKNLNWIKSDNSVENTHRKNQFSNIFLPQVEECKQKPSKQDFLLKFKENIKKKCSLGLKIKHFIIFPKLLGQGTYSKVYKAIHRKTGMICAIKVIQKQQIISSNLIDNLIQEIRIMSLYDHPNITKLWGFFEQGPKFYMVIDYCSDGYLYNLIKNFDHKHGITKQKYVQNLKLIQQICLAIEYLHDNNIMHRDIKPENILLTMGDTVKISDFGWARIIHSPSEELRRTLCGTPLYLAPQRIRQTQYSKSVDLWAIGILTYELLTGKIPFTIDSIQDLHKIVNQDISFEEIAMFPHAVDFVSLLLQKDGSKRSQAHKLSEHPFLTFDFGFDENAFMYELDFGRIF